MRTNLQPILRHSVAVVLVTALAATGLSAQPDLSMARQLGPGDDVSHDVALADFDGDGDLEIVLANAPDTNNFAVGANTVYLNDGTGNYNFFGTLDASVKETTLQLKAADFDQDGDLDVVADGRIYLNNGSSAFCVSLNARHNRRRASISNWRCGR